MNNDNSNDTNFKDDKKETLETLEKDDKVKNKNKKKNDGCYELKNIAYKTMLINGTDINPICKSNSENNINKFLTEESKSNKLETWCKLNKTQKIIKLDNFTEKLKLKDSLNEYELQNLKDYLNKSLERKMLIKTKEVTYNKELNEIDNLPFLHFNKIDRTYYFKKDDKHVSTIKSLGPDKKSKVKTIKNN
jgi:hypothetical protein